ncbi:MAG: hypothetical protein MUC95_04650 [Spirochaetes bacterium]|nr:hypothetical protein [Spirochaetota bacterium]
MINFLARLTDWILKGGSVTYREAAGLFEINEPRDVVSLLSFANVIRDKFLGSKLKFYANINLKIKECDRNCDICFKNPRFDINISDSAKEKKDLIGSMVEEAGRLGADSLIVALCGGGAGPAADFNALKKIVNKISSIDVEPRVTLGMLPGKDSLEYSRFCFDNDSGNIDNSEFSAGSVEKAVFFSERFRYFEPARNLGYKISSGLISGAGEPAEQRLIPSFVLRELAVDTIVLNLLSPRKNSPAFPPIEALKIISVYRFMHPQREIILAGSQWKNFKIIRSIILLAGANGVMAGNFFSAPAKNILEDVKSMADFNLVQ